MTAASDLEILRPDDWHLHLRDGAMLRAVLGFSAEVFGRAIVMPNLVPPVRTADEAATYRARILDCLPAGHPFVPLMTCYLTDSGRPEDIREGHALGLFTAAKLYPAGATTNSDNGVTDVARIAGLLGAMEEVGMPLLVHGEVTEPTVDIFDRETVFIDRVLDPLRRRFPALPVVLEHATTKVAVDYVLAAGEGLAATITPHHLVINRNALFAGGLRPHAYCLPVAKREGDRLALRRAAVSGDGRFFLGTDSAPHPARLKEADCGCAGIFNAPTALETVVQVFDEEHALDKLEAFVSLNGPRFYGLPPNTDKIVLRRASQPVDVDAAITVDGGDVVQVFGAERGLHWAIADGRRPAAQGGQGPT
jgi:dihydroorotase